MPPVMLTGSPLRPPWRNSAESHLTGIVLLPFRRHAKPRVMERQPRTCGPWQPMYHKQTMSEHSRAERPHTAPID